MDRKTLVLETIAKEATNIARREGRNSHNKLEESAIDSGESVRYSFSDNFPSAKIEENMGYLVERMQMLLEEVPQNGPFSNSFKEYIKKTQSSPLPTDQQCVNYAKHVAEQRMADFGGKARRWTTPDVDGAVLYVEAFPSHFVHGVTGEILPLTDEIIAEDRLSFRGELPFEKRVQQFGYLGSHQMFNPNSEIFAPVNEGLMIGAKEGKHYHREKHMGVPEEFIKVGSIWPAGMGQGYSSDRIEAALTNQAFVVRDLIQKGRDLYKETKQD